LEERAAAVAAHSQTNRIPFEFALAAAQPPLRRPRKKWPKLSKTLFLPSIDENFKFHE